MDEKKELKKVLGKADLFAIGFGCIIGWGWISMGSFWLGSAGLLGACISFIIAGCLMMFIALSYAELASAMPKAGGPQNFAWRAFGPKVSFVAGWSLLLGPTVFCGWLCNAAIVALDYLFPLSSSPLLYTVYGYEVHLASLIVYMVLAVLMIGLAYIGISGMSKVQNLSVIIMIGIAVLFIAAAFVKGDPKNMEPLIANGSIGIVGNILTCANFLGGFECVSQSAEESRVAKREIGKMIILVMVASVAWFLLTFVATSLSLPHEAVKGSNLAAVDAMTALFNNNPLAGKAMILVGLLGILTSWISTYITGSRLMFSMSRGGMLPPFLARLHPKYGTPYRAVLVIGVVMLLSGFLGGGVNVWFPSATGFMNTLSYVLVAVSFIQLRRKAPDMPRPYKAPHIMIGVMAVVMGGILLAVSLPGVPNTGLKWPYEILVVVGWILLGIVMFIKIVREPGGLEKIDRNMAEVLIDEETAAK